MLGAGRGSVKVSRPFLDFTLWIIFLSIFIKSQREREREREIETDLCNCQGIKEHSN
jgi:hypothetical protein